MKDIPTQFFAILSLLSVSASAQKLPTKQQGSLRAPANVRVDGKANEWSFQAYNNATEVFYTMAHDADNIYLVIKTSDESTARKIVSGGVTFTISAPGKKLDNEAAGITYPRFNYKNMPYIKFSLKDVPTDSIDYFVASNNKRFASQGKFVKVKGIKGLDSLVSVYNTDGIAVASAFDKSMNYTYELSVARKLIQPLINSEEKFSYKVLLNPIQIGDMPGVDIKRDANGNIIGVNIEKALNSKLSQSAQVPTDFSGEYVLTK